MGGNDRFGGGGGRSGFGGGGGGGWSGPPGSEKHKQISMKLYAMQIPVLFGIFLLLPALNCSFFQLVEVVEDPLVPTLGGDRNNQNRTAEKNCGA